MSDTRSFPGTEGIVLSSEQDSLWLSRPLPRYTSYPPAPFFHDGVGAGDYAAALAQLPQDEPVSLYLHIPFCRALCLYCGCHTAVTNRQERVDSYLEALKAEMALVERLAGRRLQLSRIHFGGGTPNIISPGSFRALMAFIAQHFVMDENTETAVELDPRVLTEEFVQAMAESGVKRASLGVQDMDAQVQDAIGRIQPFAQVAQACTWLRQHGITRINFDLIYGLPRQTLQSAAETARQCVALGPDRVALFSYAHVPQIKPQQKALEAHGLPDKKETLALEEAMRGAFVHAGYAEIAMDHFAKPEDALTRAMQAGTLHRNFQGFTDDTAQALVGLGASSLSQIGRSFFQNEKEEDAYKQKVNAGTLATLRGYHSTAEDSLRAEVIEVLMCQMAVNPAALAQRHGFTSDFFAPENAALKPFIDAGLAMWTADGALRLSGPHRMAVRALAYVFDVHSPKRAQVYSKAS